MKVKFSLNYSSMVRETLCEETQFIKDKKENRMLFFFEKWMWNFHSIILKYNGEKLTHAGMLSLGFNDKIVYLI
jgi:hypothetical protein